MTKTLRCDIGLMDERTVVGYVYDTVAPDVQFVVEILVDDVPVAAVHAAAFSPTLAAEGAAHPNHAFVHTLSAALIDSSHVITARLANLAIPIGPPIDLDRHPRTDPGLMAPGAIETVESRMITGWINAPAGGAAMVCAVVAGEEVAATIARTWTSRQIGGEARPVLAFALPLPAILANNEHHLITVTTATGVALAGSPLKLAQTGAAARTVDSTP